MSNYKPKKKKLIPTSERKKHVRKKPMNWKQYAIIGLMLLAIGAWIFSQFPKSGATKIEEPAFVKESKELPHTLIRLPNSGSDATLSLSILKSSVREKTDPTPNVDVALTAPPIIEAN